MSARETIEHLIIALEPFAALVTDGADAEPIPTAGDVHCLIYGDNDLGDLDCADFHGAVRAIRDARAFLGERA